MREDRVEVEILVLQSALETEVYVVTLAKVDVSEHVDHSNLSVPSPLSRELESESRIQRRISPQRGFLFKRNWSQYLTKASYTLHTWIEGQSRYSEKDMSFEMGADKEVKPHPSVSSQWQWPRYANPEFILILQENRTTFHSELMWQSCNSHLI